MTAVTEPPPRIATLDVLRGVAVMGIFAVNVVAFAMPMQAYFNPTAYGWESTADAVIWAGNFLLIDGKMRGLFSLLFGASMLLVIERAEADGRSGGGVHYNRMVWLLLFGLAHHYLIWFGDILFLYAAVGMIAFLFRRKAVKALLVWAAVFLTIDLLLLGSGAAFFIISEAAATATAASAETLNAWAEMSRDFAPPGGAALASDLALHRGGWIGLVEHRLLEKGLAPVFGLLFGGPETLGYMLLGMAGLKSGFLTGAWEDRRYRRIALVTLSIGLPAYAVLAWINWRSGFSVSVVFAVFMAASTPFRLLMMFGYAALIIALTRRGGALVERIAAAGRAAFTNYLGTSILASLIFYGYGIGLYGHLSRVEAWLFVPVFWLLMLAWSKPWLDRHLYGPFEWLWRSLSRRRLQPMRRPRAAPAAAGPAVAAE